MARTLLVTICDSSGGAFPSPSLFITVVSAQAISVKHNADPTAILAMIPMDWTARSLRRSASSQMASQYGESVTPRYQAFDCLLSLKESYRSARTPATMAISATLKTYQE
jgi:hypothetical protein